MGAFAADVDRAAGQGPAAGRLPQLLRPGHRPPRYSHLEYSHELYCAGHLIQAAVATSRATGETPRCSRSPGSFADHLVDTFLGQSGGLDGHPIVETALVELYRETGEAGLPGRWPASSSTAARARRDRRLRLRRPLPAGPPAGPGVGHRGRPRGPAAVPGGRGRRRGRRDRRRRAAGLLDRPLGRHGRDQDRADRRHRLAAFGRVLRRRLRAAAGPRLQRDLRVDREPSSGAGGCCWPPARPSTPTYMERVLYNGFGGRAVHRRAAVLLRQPAAAARPITSRKTTRAAAGEWFSCACCPPNIMRLIASLGHYVATVAGPVLYLHAADRLRAHRPAAGRPARRRGHHRLPVGRDGGDQGDRRARQRVRPGRPGPRLGQRGLGPGQRRAAGRPARAGRLPGDPPPLAARRRAVGDDGRHARG